MGPGYGEDLGKLFVFWLVAIVASVSLVVGGIAFAVGHFWR